MTSWTHNFQRLLNLFLQPNCPLCQRSTKSEFCPNCFRQLQKCQVKNLSVQSAYSLPVFAWGVYGGTLKRAIAAMKYENHPEIARPLGEWLGEAWLNSAHYSHQVVVVPIPMHPSKQKERGYNQAALIAQSFCQITGLKLKQNALERVRSTEAQFGLSASEREKNLTEAFAVGQKFRRRRPDVSILLVDDIYTTGATAQSAVAAFAKCGIKVDSLVAVATTRKE